VVARVYVCLSVCISVRGSMPVLLHGPGCTSGKWQAMSPSCTLLGGFAIGARVTLLWQHYEKRRLTSLLSDMVTIFIYFLFMPYIQIFPEPVVFTTFYITWRL